MCYKTVIPIAICSLMEFHFGHDKERKVKKDRGWNEFKDYITRKNPNVNVDNILKKIDTRKPPGISYGILEFVLDEASKSAHYHMFRRRHTIEYGILLQGYGQKNQLFDLICLLSQDEVEIISTCEWKDLWDEYWIDKSCTAYTNLREQSIRRFTEIKELVILLKSQVNFKVKDRPLIFPKGKSENNETGIETATREAEEETKSTFDVNDSSTGILYFADPICQNYLGSNGHPYIDYYYIWKRHEMYECDKTYIEDIDKFSISHELEYDVWIEIPIFKTVKEFHEWLTTIKPFQTYGIYQRHFDAIMFVHEHLCFH